MENPRLHIAIACFVGAFIGALLGLELKAYHPFLWIPSALVGGLIAYLAYDLRQVGRAIARAWREVFSWRPSEVLRHLLLLCGGIVGYAGILSLGWIASYFVADAAYLTFPALRTPLYVGYWQFGVLCVPFCAGMAAIIMAFAFLSMVKTYQFKGQIASEVHLVLRISRWVALLANPIVLPFTVMFFYGKFLHWGVSRVPAAGRLIARLAKRVFILIHSNVRTLCFVDAAIGMTVGYFVGSALIGGAIGAVWGWLNYEIVSVRILKVAPARVRE